MKKTLLIIVGICIAYILISEYAGADSHDYDGAQGFYFGYNHGSYAANDDFDDIQTILVGFQLSDNIVVQMTYGILDTELDDFDYRYDPPTNLHSPKRNGDKYYDGNPIGLMAGYKLGPVVAAVGGMWISEGTVFLSEDGSRYWTDAPDDDILLDASLGLRHTFKNHLSIGAEYSYLRGPGANIGYEF